MTRTKHPVVLVHGAVQKASGLTVSLAASSPGFALGVFGYGRKRPFWNRWLGYWPEQELDEMDANYLVLDVGALSSDHDRACEAFYQLYGGRVDYGEAHALLFGHDRFGESFEVPLHPNWSAENPVHLLGHSVGATTAIELYQLICQDFFGVGSNHEWVKSIVSIAGPLSGTTLTHFFGLHDARLVPLTLGHAIGASLCLWHRLQAHFPVLKNVFDYRMPQWEFVTSYGEVVSSKNRILMSPDVAVYDILPARRLHRNQSLRWMDKPYLVSVVTSSSSSMPLLEIAMASAIALLVVFSGVAWFIMEAVEVAVACSCVAFATWLWLRKRIFLPMMQWRMRRCVLNLHDIFDGFDRNHWEHNDGAVNICSMKCPQYLSSTDAKTATTSLSDSDSDVSTASSSSLSTVLVAPATRNLKLNRFGFLTLPSRAGDIDGGKRFERGVWYVHKVASNHKAGTNFDRASPSLYRHLLRLIANEFEG